MGGPEQLELGFLSPEPEKSAYFTQCDLLDAYPDLLSLNITWQEMIERKVVFSPQVAFSALKKAATFLCEQESGNQAARCYWGNRWLEDWEKILVPKIPFGAKAGTAPLIETPKLVDFYQVSIVLPGIEIAKVGFMASGEGHAGHRYFVREMSGLARQLVLGDGPTILALEQDSYHLRPGVDKPRNGRLLPLELVITLWSHNPWVNVVTILPEMPAGKDPSVFYDNVFERLVGGERRGYCLVDDLDPNRATKTLRGLGAELGDRRRFLIINHLPVPRTTLRVRKDWGGQYLTEAVDPYGMSSWDDLFGK